MYARSTSAALLKQTHHLIIKFVHNTCKIQIEKDIVRKYNTLESIEFKNIHKGINRLAVLLDQR